MLTNHKQPKPMTTPEIKFTPTPQPRMATFTEATLDKAMGAFVTKPPTVGR